ncbi:undecaprenyl-diphosphate phosphatase [Hydrogenovibrio sp. 3SP14C1]|uniref:undecaprenyl-diphosphate phosphatase n=1 Tax=Hydrogenovibrio sp. 3SP14C1 TaxID=3038774 RepID=UPI002416F97E|nr:undecaprenyl-diphosphate phosphatase [Hydrogenovibrio sp. 3SP14C1]MDG4812682.1 undecaprenyl-diphosphate phosphatase [Hydrogenovibrio sp. 3SP14C1]
MEIFQAAILGIIEGLTEFLPISSTGHLIVVSDWLGIEQTKQNTAFEVIIQVAAILAIFSHYKEKFSLQHLRLWNNVLIAFLPIAAIGFIFQDTVKAFFTIETVAWLFIIGGVIFLIVERLYVDGTHRTKDIEDLTLKQALWIGIIQVFALIPGTSRAGASIVGGVMMGLDRKTAAEFSFLLALPVLMAASGLDLIKHYEDFASTSWTPLMVGFLMAFIAAWLTIKVFIKFLQAFTFNAFGIYRIVFGIILLIWFV